MVVEIRAADSRDWPEIWAILSPVFAAGETYAVARDISEAAARQMWLTAPAACFIARADGVAVGTYYLKTNHPGGGAHVCNCGYVTNAAARGRGVARAMCLHSQDAARALGYKAMQFNLVLASNGAALKLWDGLGFERVGRLPRAFSHPVQGLVDAVIYYKWL